MYENENTGREMPKLTIFGMKGGYKIWSQEVTPPENKLDNQ